MRENRISMWCAEGRSPNLEDLCEAMFIEGARALGFAFDAQISVEAQEKILQAANSLAEKLSILVEIRGEIERKSKHGN
ncbi:MAG: hypothetical protein ACLQAT_11345 [Candidatus Binataceae bacterium]